MREEEVTRFIKRQIAEYRRVLITGVPGAGKSYYADKLGLIELDAYGRIMGQKWVIDVQRIPSGDLAMCGVSDNIDVVSSSFPLTIFLLPPPKVFRDIARLRATAPQTPPEFKKGFINFSEFTDSLFQEYWLKVFSQIQSERVILLRLSDRRTAQSLPWHKK